MNEGDTPKDCDSQLDRYGKLCGHITVRCFQAEVAEELARALVEQTEKDSEDDIIEQTATDEGGEAVPGPKIRAAISEALPDGRATAPRARTCDVLLIMEPD